MATRRAARPAARPGGLRGGRNLHPPNRRRLVARVRALDEEQAERLRLLPLASSFLGITAVIGNRLVDGATPTLVASSVQSRADVATIFVAAVLGLTGLQWLSVKPKAPKVVDLEVGGEAVEYVRDGVGEGVGREVRAFWDAAGSATKTDMMVVFWKGRCVSHFGFKRRGLREDLLGDLRPGKLLQESQATNTSRSLANLALFPGRFEFFEYLPSDTQAVHVQPMHPDGVVILGSATQRSFTILDQAWIGCWADKLSVVLDGDETSKR